jgi:hypothetical protein
LALTRERQQCLCRPVLFVFGQHPQFLDGLFQQLRHTCSAYHERAAPLIIALDQPGKRIRTAPKDDIELQHMVPVHVHAAMAIEYGDRPLAVFG